VALLSAKRLIGMIRGECERVEIAGSVRRLKEEVKDVELVVIPKAGLLALFPMLLIK
jgi:DNA polymerase/3'-5' exonuclease PolX